MKDASIELTEAVIYEQFLMEEFKLQKNEETIKTVQAMQTASAGRFQFQKNTQVGAGTIILTNQRFCFIGRSVGSSANGGGVFVGGQDFEVPIDHVTGVYKDKFSIPEKIVSLGLSPLIAKILRNGYLVIEHGKNAENGFFCMDCDEMISKIKELLRDKKKK